MIRIGRVLVLLLVNLLIALMCEGAYRTWLHLQAPRSAAGAVRFEMYGVGESTLVGEPYEPKISIPRLIDYMFARQVGGRPILVNNLAEAAVPLYPQSLAFERAMAARDVTVPGVVLIVSGHNEGIRPWNLGMDETFVPNVLTECSAIIRDALLLLRRRRVVARPETMAAYEHYLRRVIEDARRNGLVPIVATMASNITRVEPNHDGDDEIVRQTVAQGVALEDQGRHAEARDLYVATLRTLDHARAPLFYRAGRCEETLGNFTVAREHYWSAVDNDPRHSFGRATRLQNDLVRRLARAYDVPLVDTVAIFERQSSTGLQPAELFVDGQHPSIGGYLLMAQTFAEIIAQRFDAPIARPLRDANEVVAAMGFDAQDERGALIDAGSWLVATSVNHPLPRDRMALATATFRAAMGKGDDFSAWLGLGLAQAALRGGLQSGNELARVCHYTKKYELAPDDVARTADRLQVLGVDAEIVTQVRALGVEGRASARP